MELKIHNNVENILTIKKTFLEIINSFMWELATKETLDELYFQLKNFFNNYNLNDLQFYIEFNYNTIDIIPVREIDKLTFNALMSSSIRKEKIKRLLR